MKTKTILIAILSTFLLLMLPNVSAVQYNEIKSNIMNKLKEPFKETTFLSNLLEWLFNIYIQIAKIFYVALVILIMLYFIVGMGIYMEPIYMILSFLFSITISIPMALIWPYIFIVNILSIIIGDF